MNEESTTRGLSDTDLDSLVREVIISMNQNAGEKIILGSIVARAVRRIYRCCYNVFAPNALW